MTGEAAPFQLICEFELSEEETRKIVARRSFRAALGGLTPRVRAAPLAIFAGLLAVAAGLAVAGVVSRRVAEIAILLLVIGFAVARSGANFALRRAYRAERGRAEALGRSGRIRVQADEDRISLAAAAPIGALRYADCLEADEADDVIYLWGADGQTIAIPTRVLPPGASALFLARIRAEIGAKAA
jgi:hypothetical protein